MPKKNFEPTICPVCAEGEFTPFADRVFHFRHGKKEYSVAGQQYAKCSACGTTGYLPGQRAANHASIVRYQATLPDYISPSDVLAVRERYGLTQKQASQIFKGGTNGFSKWERGVTFPSGATAMLLKTALLSPDAMHAFAKIAQVDFPIIDQKSATEEAFSSAESLQSQPRTIIHCTHMEYRDELAPEAYDNEFDNENLQEWTTLKTKSTKKTSSFSRN